MAKLFKFSASLLSFVCALYTTSPKKLKTDEIRLNKYISNSGICSRRDADIYIQSGNVKVNGIPIIEMGYQVKPGDVVNFDGVTLTPEKKEYFVLNKPKNFTTSEEEVEHRNVQERCHRDDPQR